MSFFKAWVSGFGFVVMGIRLIMGSKKLFLWSLVPMVINLCLIVYGFSLGSRWISGWVVKSLGFLFTDTAGLWYRLAYYPFFGLMWFAFSVALIYVAYILLSIIASPFNAILAEIMLLKNGTLDGSPKKFLELLKTSTKMLGVSIIKALILLTVGLLLFVFSFIPILNFLAAFVAFLILASDAMDYSWEVQSMSLRARWKYFKKEFPIFAGMACFLGLTVLVPGLTLLILPATVVGAANLYRNLDIEKQ